MIRLLFINFFSIPLILFSQEIITISGKVLNKNTQEPQCYASIGIKGKAIGTTSNSGGDFVFHIPQAFINDTLFISMLGYETFKAPVKDIINTHTFYLNPRPINLKEVVVNPMHLTAWQILKKMKKNLKKNYVGQPYIADAFYREFTSIDTVWTRALEAATSIYDRGKQRYSLSALVKIEGIRISEDFCTKNYLYTNLLSLTWAMEGAPFDPNKNLTYSIDSIMFFNNRLVYVISSSIDRGDKFWTMEYNLTVNGAGEETVNETGDSILVDGIVGMEKYYITVDNFSLLKYFSYEDFKFCDGWNGDFKMDKFLYEVSYESINNKLFPKHIKKVIDWIYASALHLKDTAFTVQCYEELYMNNIKTDSIKEFPKETRMDFYGNLAEQGYAYDPEFWKNYNYLVDDTLRKIVMRDLEIQKVKGKK